MKALKKLTILADLITQFTVPFQLTASYQDHQVLHVWDFLIKK